MGGAWARLSFLIAVFIQERPVRGAPRRHLVSCMSSTHPVLVSLSSFGASEVRRHGQGWFVSLCAAAGADGVEIRGELLREGPGQEGPGQERPGQNSAELRDLSALIRDHGLDSVYSSPEMLWSAQGELDLAALERGLQAAAALSAPVLKMSIGGYGKAEPGSLSRLAERLDACDTKLLIENDQTAAAGTLQALEGFFADADQAGLPLGMTFDVGNWHWNGECPLQAAQVFAGRVRYVHYKGVQRQPARWVAVPLTDSAAPWRAIMRAMPRGLPCAIEYPLVGDDLLSVTRGAVQQLRDLEISL